MSLRYWLYDCLSFFLGRNIYYFRDFFYIFFNVLSNFKLELKLSDKKLKDSILLYFLTDLVRAVDGNTGDDPDKIYHVDSIHTRMITDMR